MNLYSWGANSYGQLSHGIRSEQCLHPTEASSTCTLNEASLMAAGGGHTVVLNRDGSVLGAGSNTCGQIGSCQDNSTTLSRIENLQEFKFVQIACGWDSTYGITDTGTVVAWGSNKYGQLGVSKSKVTTTSHPVVLETKRPIAQVAAGLRHTALLTDKGQVFVCGRGNRGQLGVVHREGREKLPAQDYDSLVHVPGLENVQEVACGQHHTLALTRDGCLYGWGDNKRGQLGAGEDCFPFPHLLFTVPPGASIRAGWTHSAILSEGCVTSWGRNNYCQLGHSGGQQVVSQPQQLIGLKGVKQLELGSEHNLALLENGEVWSWGWNEHGNCGTGTVENVATPLRVVVPFPVVQIGCGAGHSLALTTM